MTDNVRRLADSCQWLSLSWYAFRRIFRSEYDPGNKKGNFWSELALSVFTNKVLCVHTCADFKEWTVVLQKALGMMYALPGVSTDPVPQLAARQLRKHVSAKSKYKGTPLTGPSWISKLVILYRHVLHNTIQVWLVTTRSKAGTLHFKESSPHDPHIKVGPPHY